MNYTKTCWYCKIGTMQPKCSYYLCTECGATWNEQPKLKPYLDIAIDHQSQDGTKKYHPVMRSGRVKPPYSPEQKAARVKARKLGTPL